MSNAKIFEHIIAKQMNNSTRGYFMQFHERVRFKLTAASHFLNRLEELVQKAGSLVGAGIERDDVELNLDAFLYEVVGAIDPLLQEIKVAFKLVLNPKEVSMPTIIPKLLKGSQVKETLGELHGDTQGWFCRLREYRNHSAHRKIIGFHINLALGSGTGIPTVFLYKDPLDPDKGRADTEVIKYCQDSLKNMEQIIENLYGLCTTDLTTAKP